MSCFCSSVRPRCRGCGAGFVLRNHPHGDVPVGSPAVSGSGELGKSVGRFTAVILKSDGQQAHIWVYFRIVFVSTNHCAGGWDLQARSMVFKSIPCGMATEVLHLFSLNLYHVILMVIFKCSYTLDYIATLFRSGIYALQGLAVCAIQCKVVLFVFELVC